MSITMGDSLFIFRLFVQLTDIAPGWSRWKAPPERLTLARSTNLDYGLSCSLLLKSYCVGANVIKDTFNS
jgi:hypothetical protein